MNDAYHFSSAAGIDSGYFKHIVSYSISQGSIVNVVALTSQPHLAGAAYDGPWVEDCSREELLACYAGWEPEVIHLLEVQISF